LCARCAVTKIQVAQLAGPFILNSTFTHKNMPFCGKHHLLAAEARQSHNKILSLLAKSVNAFISLVRPVFLLILTDNFEPCEELHDSIHRTRVSDMPSLAVRENLE
jgi:hypothetical protein